MGDYLAQTGKTLSAYVKETMERGEDPLRLIRACLKANAVNWHNLSLPARSYFAETKFYLASAPLWQATYAACRSCQEDPMAYTMGTTQVDVAMAAVHKHVCHVGKDRAKCRTCK